MNKEINQPSVDTTPEQDRVSTSVPPAMMNEHKPSAAHSRSHAAHLDSGSAGPHSKPAGELRNSPDPSGRRQP